jgi:AcrR family transcriptional regulator
MKEKSTSRAAERRDQRRKDILQTASDLFSQHGYENVTLRAIAESLGYAHAALYRYFQDKSALLAEICRETFDLMLAEVERLETESSDPEQKLFAVSRGFVQFGLAHPQHFRIVFFGPENRNGVRAGEYIDTIGRPLFDRLVQIFISCAEVSGRPAETRLLDAQTWWVSLFGTTQVLITSGPVASLSAHDAIVNRHIEVMWRGFLP